MGNYLWATNYYFAFMFAPSRWKGPRNLYYIQHSRQHAIPMAASIQYTFTFSIDKAGK